MSEATLPVGEHAAFVHVPRADNEPAEGWLWRLECELEACLERERVGELAGVETTESEWVAFAYGPSANALLRALHRVLWHWSLPAGSYVAWRRGGLEEPEERQQLSQGHGVRGGSGQPRRTAPAVRTLGPRDLLTALALRPRPPRRGGHSQSGRRPET